MGDRSGASLSRRRFLQLAGIAGLATVVPSASPAFAAPSRFVSRVGTRLYAGGRPWYLYGGSTYGTSNLGGAGTIADTISLGQAAGLNTLRIVNFFDERGLSDSAPFDPTAWGRVDALLDAMRRAGLRAILDLSAYRNHLHNRALQTGSTVTPYGQDWSRFIRFVARRVNSVNGTTYKRDPTIALVSFAGEPNPPNSEEPLKPTTQELTAFYARVFSQWKKEDTKHLVSSGGLLHIDWEELYGNPSGSGIDWKAIASLPKHDVPAIHTYWASFPPTPVNDFKTPKFASYCAGIGKPWITEEFGFLQQPFDPSTGIQYSEADRGSWFDTVYGIQLDRNAAGVAFWNLGREVHPASHDVNPDTPMTWSSVVGHAPVAGASVATG